MGVDVGSGCGGGGGGMWAVSQKLISVPALGALRTGALFAIINDEVMIMVYHKGYDAVYTVLCSSSSSRSHSHIIVVVLVVVVVVVVVVSVVAVALQRQICNNIFVTNERFFLLC